MSADKAREITGQIGLFILIQHHRRKIRDAGILGIHDDKSLFWKKRGDLRDEVRDGWVRAYDDVVGAGSRQALKLFAPFSLIESGFENFHSTVRPSASADWAARLMPSTSSS
jgi:hypothetical protein